MKKIFLLSTILIVCFASCKKTELADNKATGEGLVGFSIKDPSSGTNLGLNAATPNSMVEITWNPSKPGLSTLPTYTWVAALKSVGNFETPLLEILSDNAGKDTKLTLTYKQLDDALKAKGIADGAKTDLIWTVRADNGSVKILALNSSNLSITRFKDGASPFMLLGPMTSSTPIAIDPGSTTQSLKFNWTRSTPAPGGAPIKYKLLLNETTDFSTPLITITPGNNGTDSFATITYQAINDSLNAKGLTNLSAASNLKWTVVAMSGTWSQSADYINDIVILREVRLYMPGSFQTATGNGTNWTPANAPELIPDKRAGLTNNLYYIYIYLPANTEFKITQGRSWDVNYGGAGGDLSTTGANLMVSAAGVYRISVNRTTMKYNIMEGRMGFVGGATQAGWNPPNVFPDHALGYVEKNLFLGVHTFTADEWKLIDNNQWNNGSNAVDETRSYGTSGASGTELEINGGNFRTTAPGNYRVIWDGRNVNNVKYEISPATEMRVVGNGMQGVAEWTPSASPQMTYISPGKWQITLNLLANKEIKFLAGNDWGAFDYEDSGDNGSSGNTTRRKITWSGNDNFRTPSAGGMYTITLDEHAQTVTITP